MGMGEEERVVGSAGREREKRRGVGAKRERVPVPVLRGRQLWLRQTWLVGL